MNAPLRAASLHATADAVASACARVAPSWPLGRFIAVNPHWGWIDRPIEEAGAAVGVLAGMRLLQGVSPQRKPLIADLAGWRTTVVHQISQHCAAHFDDGQARWHMPLGGDEAGLYRSWTARLAADRGIDWPQGRKQARLDIARLPADPMAAIQHAVEQLAIPPHGIEACLTAWLLDLNGWAANCAWHRWEARLAGRDDHHVVELLAIRASWDLLLSGLLAAHARQDWAEDWSQCDAAVLAERSRQRPGWDLLQAQERTFQSQLTAQLCAVPVQPTAPASVQAVFCIDVRSEVFRRALEAADPDVATRGFAGFFGLPVDYRPVGSTWRQPQLPGLMAPTMTVDESAGDRSLTVVLAERRRRRLMSAAAWEQWRGIPAAGFSFVESCGAAYAGAMIKASLSGESPAPWAHAGLATGDICGLQPRLALSPEAGADFAARVLHAMGLTSGFAPLVLLCGHGGQSANNPHAAGLDCGACGGQTGEVNARALAGLLNDPAVRHALRTRHIDIPASTHVLAGLHNTTTDEVTLFDVDAVPAALQAQLAALRASLDAAGDAARAERAPGLGLPPMPAARLLATLRGRATHWAETRPEWGLANNAAFIAAPRARTRGLNLGGRVFLHDYDRQLDPDGSVLTLILTAPMVVAHWINLQYLASSVDPLRQGAGNKLLHNVVGGGVGVFEGNGGDLRIGLPWQSVHDGERLRHSPLRLSVFVEAPREALDAVIAEHETVRQLVDNGWLHLIAIEADTTPRFSLRVRGGGWRPAC